MALVLVAVGALSVVAAGCQEGEASGAQSNALSSSVWPAPPITDRTIVAQVRRELASHPAVAGQKIEVEVTEGVVTLRGEVDNLRARRAATEIGEAIKGVRAVVNVIGVKPALRPDAAIRRDVLDALATNAATSAYPLTVEVRGSQVTLRGRLESWVEKQLAGEVARGIRGVAALNNAITVTYPRHRHDSAITRDVQAALQNDVRLNPGSGPIDVDVHGGRVWLRGTVGSAAEKSQASYDAWVYGTRAVDDSELVVEYWAPDPMRAMQLPSHDDAKTRRAVRAALTLDPRVSVEELRVRAQDGVVTLDGVVDSLQGKRAAEETAGDTVGVFRVVDLLDVREVPTVDDARLARRVHQVLGWDPVLGRYRLGAGVDEHVAWLRGVVPSVYDRQLAERAVAQIPGITAIADHLRISGSGPALSDRGLRNRVRERLDWTPGLIPGRVKVRAADQVVTLSGVVRSYHARRLAEARAWDAGAWRVDNTLIVER